MTVDARSWLHKLQVISLGRDDRSRNVDAIMTIEYFVEGLHRVVLIINNNESIYYAPCIRVIKPAQRRFTIVHSIPE